MVPAPMTNSSAGVVEHDGLPRRDARTGSSRVSRIRPSTRSAEPRDDPAVCPQLSHRAQRELRRFPAAGEDHPIRGDDADVQAGGRADGDRAGDRLDAEDVPGPAVGAGRCRLSPLRWPIGVGEGPVVLAEHLAGLGVDHRTRSGTELVDQVAVGVAVRDEADVVGVRLGGDREPAPRRLLP